MNGRLKTNVLSRPFILNRYPQLSLLYSLLPMLCTS